jgi:hypothetical protein
VRQRSSRLAHFAVQTLRGARTVALVQILFPAGGPLHIAEGTQLFPLAGRPTKAKFVKVYGAKGPTMTWAQPAKAGVDAKHFQSALAEKTKA